MTSSGPRLTSHAVRILVCLALALVIAAAASGCGGSSSARTPTNVKYDAPGRIRPPKPAPPLSLRNYDGRPVSLAQFRGHAVLVTFVFAHCPDTCPLIVSKLRTARALLGHSKSKLQIIAVSTDPAQDSPAIVRRFLARRGMLGKMDYLLGGRKALRGVWSAWGVAAKRVSPQPEDVEHSAMIYGISGSGRVTTLYPADMDPQWVAHDVPVLASH